MPTELKMTLVWNKCQGDAWCPFMTVNLTHAHFQGMDGVYVIWHGGTTPKTVYVGKGNIASRIQAHRNERNITQYLPNGLFVTWAKVPAASQDGVESYLIQALKPLQNQSVPAAIPVPVNHPWS